MSVVCGPIISRLDPAHLEAISIQAIYSSLYNSIQRNNIGRYQSSCLLSVDPLCPGWIRRTWHLLLGPGQQLDPNTRLSTSLLLSPLVLPEIFIKLFPDFQHSYFLCFPY